MSEDDNQKKAKTVSSGTSSDEKTDFQRRAEADTELQQAINDVPIKNYDDYDIAVEGKSAFGEALFESEDDLINALNTDDTATTNTATANEPEPPPSAAVELGSQAQQTSEKAIDNKTVAIESAMDFSEFTARKQRIDSGTAPPAVTVISKGVNDSPIAENIVYEDSADEQLQVATNEDTAAPLSPFGELKYAWKNHLSNKQRMQLLKSAAVAIFLREKDKFDEYFGRKLSLREMELDFIFPTQKSNSELGSIKSVDELKVFFSSKGLKQNTFFKRVYDELLILNRSKISNRSRVALLDAYTEPFIERTKSFIASIERKPSSPEDSKRLQLIEIVPEAIKVLITIYKHAYSKTYNTPNFIYGPQRKKMHRLLFRLFDLLLLEQRLATTICLPMPSAQAINRLFGILSLYEPDFTSANRFSQFLKSDTTVKSLFIRYQIGLLFPMTSLSPSEQNLALRYLEYNLVAVESGNSLRQGKKYPLLVIDHSNSAPTTVLPREDQTDNSDQLSAEHKTEWKSYISLGTFFNQIKRDYEECESLFPETPNSNVNEHSSKLLASVDKYSTLELTSHLNRQVDMLESGRVQIANQTYHPTTLKVLSGFEQCISYFEQQYLRSQGEHSKKGQPVSGKSQWYRAANDGNAMQLQTSEKNIGIALDCGLPLIVIQASGDNDERYEGSLYQLFAVARETIGRINVSIRQVAKRCTSVDVYVEDNKSAFKALLTLDESGTTRTLLVSRLREFPRAGEFEMEFPDESRASFALQSIKSVSPYYVEYTLI